MEWIDSQLRHCIQQYPLSINFWVRSEVKTPYGTVQLWDNIQTFEQPLLCYCYSSSAAVNVTYGGFRLEHCSSAASLNRIKLTSMSVHHHFKLKCTVSTLSKVNRRFRGLRSIFQRKRLHFTPPCLLHRGNCFTALMLGHATCSWRTANKNSRKCLEWLKGNGDGSVLKRITRHFFRP